MQPLPRPSQPLLPFPSRTPPRARRAALRRRGFWLRARARRLVRLGAHLLHLTTAVLGALLAGLFIESVVGGVPPLPALWPVTALGLLLLLAPLAGAHALASMAGPRRRWALLVLASAGTAAPLWWLCVGRRRRAVVPPRPVPTPVAPRPWLDPTVLVLRGAPRVPVQEPRTPTCPETGGR